MRADVIIATGATLFVAAGGFAAAAAFTSAANQQASTTVTIDVATGPKGDTGATGPQGPAGPPGGTVCPTGYTDGDLVINHPGGQVTLFTCLKGGG